MSVLLDKIIYLLSMLIMDFICLLKVQTEEEDEKGKLVFVCEEENQVINCLFAVLVRLYIGFTTKQEFKVT